MLKEREPSSPLAALGDISLDPLLINLSTLKILGEDLQLILNINIEAIKKIKIQRGITL